jgi:hypothetical protein
VLQIFDFNTYLSDCLHAACILNRRFALMVTPPLGLDRVP